MLHFGLREDKESYINKYTRINRQITAPRVRLIDEANKQVGVVDIKEALNQAEAAGLDLVEVAPQADPPVVRIIDWDKYRYQQLKQEQKARRQQKTLTVKQIRLRLKIGQHDLDVKLRRMRKFLEAGDKVKISLMFRGREITHQELGWQLLDRIVKELADMAVVDQSPQLMGRFLNMVLRKK